MMHGMDFSVPLKEEDRFLTTFITPWGRFRYKRAPQGFASSGDGYNRRFDEVLSDFQRQKRCVDDTLIFDDDLEEHWWRTLEFLELVGKNGIVLNPEKFQFSQRQVDFAGFRIKESEIEPLPKYLDAIRNFPTPTSITDIRSWFGLVNQVSHYAQLRDTVEPFRKFLSPKVKFYWDESLDEKFEKSKTLILDAIKEGVRIFDPMRKTCLRCDWSKLGIGFYLCQKHCQCVSDYPACCEDGWRITLCGSRFLRKSELRYAPVEGEALSVAWSLEQSKYFTLGCDDLVVIVDHMPLTKILGDRTLDEIPNTRLFRLKQRTLPWIYKIHWMPGEENFFSDATSRHPVHSEDVEINGFALMVSSMMETDEDQNEFIAMVQVMSDFNKVTAVTWERVQEATHNEFSDLLDLIEQGFYTDTTKIDSKYAEYLEYKDGLYIYDDVIMYHDRVVIPPSLRREIIDSLHAAHQGETAMMLTAQSTVFWPGITMNVGKARGVCDPCIRNAPSQPKLDPIPPRIPTTPFESVVADYFDFKGMHYLVIADRLSGWTEAYHIQPGSKNSGSSGLLTLLKQFFGTFGVPEELSSDQGKEFIANETQEFLLRWGVKHRDSSAYHPQSNGRAELAVKSTKRLLEDNIGADGELHTDKFLRAILIKRNTPDPVCKLSPAEIIFGKKLRDSIPRINKRVNIFFNNEFQSTWRDAWKQKELALRTRYQGCQKRLGEHSKSLPALEVGDRVAIQNQYGRQPNKWERTGTVVEVRDYDKYVLKVDGSGRLTLRNRRFLKKLYQDDTMFGTPLRAKPPRAPVKAAQQLHPNTDTSGTTRNQTPTQSAVPSPVVQDIEPCSMNPGVHPVTPPQSPGSLPVTIAPTTPLIHPSIPTETHPFTSVTDDRVLAPRSRPVRIRRQKLFYDADAGSYVERNPSGE